MKFFELFGQIHNKKLILFGVTDEAKKLIDEYRLPIQYFVDNDSQKWGTDIGGVPVFSPEKLKEETKDSIAVFILPTDDESISLQLQGMGLEKGKHFWIHPDNAHLKAPVTDLKYLKRELLVTTFLKGGGLYKVSLPEQNIIKLREGIFRGIKKIKDTYLISSEFHGIYHLDKEFEVIDHYEYDHIVNSHGIAFHESSNLAYVVETGADRIGIFTLNPLRRVDEIVLSPEYKDTHHINDIWIDKDILYISMFSLSGRWKQGVYDGVVLEYDLLTREKKNVLFQGLEQPHSIKIFNEKFYYCDSANFNFCCNGKNLGQFKGFLRGLNFDGRYFYIGQSETKYIDRAPEHVDHISIDCGIHIFDPENKISRFVKMPGMYIYDIVILK